MNREKIGKITYKSTEELSLLDIVKLIEFRKYVDKLYLVIDAKNNDKKSTDKYVSFLDEHDIKIDKIINRHEHYDIGWIYLHRLVKLGKVYVNYNTKIETNDIKLLINKYNVMIFLINDSDTNRYNNVIYSNGWYRDIFIDSIIEDIENINYVLNLDEKCPLYSNSNSNTNNIPNQEKILKDKICNILNLNKTNKLSEFTLNSNTGSLNFFGMKYQEFSKLKVNIQSIIKLINNQTTNETINLNTLTEKKDYMDSNTPFSDMNVFIKPIILIFDKEKEVIINDTKQNIQKYVFVDNTVQTIQNNGTIKLKYIGPVKIFEKDSNKSNIYKTVFLTKKKKNLKVVNWLTDTNGGVYVLPDNGLIVISKKLDHGLILLKDKKYIITNNIHKLELFEDCVINCLKLIEIN